MKKDRKSRRGKITRGEPPNFLGQHLMINKKLLKEMVEMANISETDTVLELGAGKGALTTVLNQRAGKVLAVEYDARFVDVLKRKTAQNPNTKIIHQDILKNSPAKKTVCGCVQYSIFHYDAYFKNAA